MDQPFPLEDATGTRGGPASETLEPAPEQGPGPRARDLPDARPTVRDRARYRPEAGRDEGSSSSGYAGRPADPDPGWEHLGARSDRGTSTPARPARPHPRDQERDEDQTQRARGPRIG